MDKKTSNKFNVDKSSSIEGKHFNFDNKDGSKSNNYFESEAKDFEENQGLGTSPKDKKIFELSEKMKRYKNEARIFREKHIRLWQS